MVLFEPTFSSDVYEYNVGWGFDSLDENQLLSINAIPTDQKTSIKIVGQRFYLPNGYRDIKAIKNNGRFSPVGISRLRITCTNDYRTMSYIVNMRNIDVN